MNKPLSTAWEHYRNTALSFVEDDSDLLKTAKSIFFAGGASVFSIFMHSQVDGKGGPLLTIHSLNNEVLGFLREEATYDISTKEMH